MINPDWMEARLPDIRRLIRNYVDLDTATPHERRAEPFLKNLMDSIDYQLTESGDWRAARDHVDWSPHPDAQQSNACWVASAREKVDERPEVIINGHVDVVPEPTEQQAGNDSDWISGRGACDTKSNLILAVEALRYLQAQGRQLPYRIRFHLPSYEEIGGNGTLALALADRRRPGLAAAICLEPTGLATFVGHRGCLTYRLAVTGPGGHIGGSPAGADPIRAAAAVISRLHLLEAQLNDEARQAPEFAWTDRPCQVTVGHISGGEWLGSTAQRCEMAGSVGTLPWQDLPAVETRLIELTKSIEAPGVEFDWDFRSGLRNQAYVSPELGVLHGLAELSTNGPERRIWNVSCDARHYHRVLRIPTLIFGAGSLARAHARDEGVSLQEVQAGVEIFVQWLGGVSSGQP